MWYVIDAVDRVADVCTDWDDEAVINGAPGLTRSLVIGRSIWSFIDGEATRFHYAQVFESARMTGLETAHRLRDEAATHQRIMTLTVTPRRDQSLRIDVATMHDHAGQTHPLLETHTGANDHRIVTCLWCHAIALGTDWIPLPDAAQHYEDLGTPQPTKLVQDVCPNCEHAVDQMRTALKSYAEKAR